MLLSVSCLLFSQSGRRFSVCCSGSVHSLQAPADGPSAGPRLGGQPRWVWVRIRCPDQSSDSTPPSLRLSPAILQMNLCDLIRHYPEFMAAGEGRIIGRQVNGEFSLLAPDQWSAHITADAALNRRPINWILYIHHIHYC